MRSPRLIPVALSLGLSLAALPLACGSGSVQSPFGPGAGGNGGEAGLQGDAGFRLIIDGGDEVDPTLGGPCEDDGQCDDRLDCTVDRCDLELGRCRFQPDDALCDDGVYCDGAERCDVRGGCMAGEVVACSDNSTCTIDTCVEATQTCRHDPRDADGDGDPTRNCGGADCDDTNPLVSGDTSEVCGNQRDDDCDGQVDEGECASPEHDACASALQVTEDGYFDLDLTATKLDYPNDCATEKRGFRDAVMELVVTAGSPVDVDVTAKLDQGNLALGTAAWCGDATSTRCEGSFDAPRGGNVARLILRGLLPGKYPLYVAADVEGTAQVRVETRPAGGLRGDQCGDALPLVANGAPVLVRLPGYKRDQRSLCGPLTGDAFVGFTLTEAADVTLIAEAQNGLGDPIISLRDAGCGSELTCRHTQPGRLFERNLPAGVYRALVAGTGPDDVSIRLETAPVSEAPPGEGCDDAQPLEVGVEQVVDLAEHEDAVYPECLVGAPDTTFELELSAKRDVALVGRFADGDTGSVSITDLGCSTHRVCGQGGGLIRATKYGLSAGTYRAVIESERGNPVGLTWFERPPVAVVHVPFAEDCGGLVTIPEHGGRFTGNTSNSFPDFSAGCDVGGQSEGGAPDQMLKLSLSTPHRVIFDMQGSSYQTMLSVRQGQICPGVELPRACAPGYWPTRSFLDLDLPAGDYFVQIDGYDGDSGAWKLDVFTAEQ